MNLLAVPQELAADAWSRGGGFVVAACNRQRLLDPNIVKADVLAGRALLWIAVDDSNIVGAGVTQTFEQAGIKVCEIIAWGARDQRRCAPLLSVIQDFARSNGCTAARLIGPKGWARHLPDFSVKALIMEKAL